MYERPFCLFVKLKRTERWHSVCSYETRAEARNALAFYKRHGYMTKIINFSKPIAA